MMKIIPHILAAVHVAVEAHFSVRLLNFEFLPCRLPPFRFFSLSRTPRPLSSSDGHWRRARTHKVEEWLRGQHIQSKQTYFPSTLHQEKQKPHGYRSIYLKSPLPYSTFISFLLRKRRASPNVKCQETLSAERKEIVHNE